MPKSSHIDIYIGNKIKERRRQLKLNQQELSKMLGVSYQQLQKYESGVTPLTLVRLFQIAQSLNVNIEYFHEGAPVGSDAEALEQSDIIIGKRTQPLRVLLVEDKHEDEVLFRKATAMCAEEVEVDSLSDPRKVLDYLSHSKSKYGKAVPDMVISDIHLPKIDGFELLKDIKATPAISHIPVVMLTNSARRRDMETSYQLQASGFIRKSVDFEAFCKSIATTMRYWASVTVLPSTA